MIALVKRSIARVAALLVVVVVVLPAAVVPDYRWRAIVVARKLTGLLKDVTWADLGDIARPRSGFELRHLARWGDPYSTIQDPYTTTADRGRGRDLFALNCAKCHGAEARGGLAPALVGRALQHGDSDWAIYRTATRGVPGTAMVGGLIARRDVWRVIAYLREFGSGGAIRTGASGPDAVTLGPAPEVTSAKLLESSGAIGEWLLPGGSYDGKRFSRDAEINTGNVSGLSRSYRGATST
jgi:mono/diheme cytochrome c family protein